MAEKTLREQFLYDHRWRRRLLSLRDHLVMLAVILVAFAVLAPAAFRLILGS